MVKYCKCGCGNIIVEKESQRYRGMPNYISGHNSKKNPNVTIRNFLPRKAYKITPTLAYILGVIEGDGNVYKNTISLTVKDKDFAQHFKEQLEKWTKLDKVSFRVVHRKHYITNYYQISLTSKLAADYINSVNIYQLHKQNNKTIGCFIKGFADSEAGCYNYLITFYNTDKKLLMYIQKLLKKLSISSKLSIMAYKGERSIVPGGKKYTIQKNQYQLNICGKNNLFLFNKYIGFNIKRKQDKLDNMYMNNKQRSFMNSLYHNKKDWKKIYNETIHN